MPTGYVDLLCQDAEQDLIYYLLVRWGVCWLVGGLFVCLFVCLLRCLFVYWGVGIFVCLFVYLVLVISYFNEL